VRKKLRGFILQFTRSDHGGRHIHVFRDNLQIGIFDKIDGPIRGLERVWSAELKSVLDEFIRDLDERGYWH